jgi:hypothetical protein
MLPGGRCDLVHLVGVTEPEIRRALTLGKGTAGSIVLCRVLEEMGVGCVSDPNRACLTTHREFEETWNRIAAECQLKWNDNAKTDTKQSNEKEHRGFFSRLLHPSIWQRKK